MERLGDNHLLGRLYPPRLGMPDLVVSFFTRSRTTQRCNHASSFLAFGLNPDTGTASKPHGRITSFFISLYSPCSVLMWLHFAYLLIMYWLYDISIWVVDAIHPLYVTGAGLLPHNLAGPNE